MPADSIPGWLTVINGLVVVLITIFGLALRGVNSRISEVSRRLDSFSEQHREEMKTIEDRRRDGEKDLRSEISALRTEVGDIGREMVTKDDLDRAMQQIASLLPKGGTA